MTGGQVAAADEGKLRLAKYAQQSQFAGGKNFFFNENQWMDSAIQKHPNAKRVKIQFGTAEYFSLLAKNPAAQPWLALGQNVQFVLGDTIYEIHE